MAEHEGAGLGEDRRASLWRGEKLAKLEGRDGPPGAEALRSLLLERMERVRWYLADEDLHSDGTLAMDPDHGALILAARTRRDAIHQLWYGGGTGLAPRQSLDGSEHEEGTAARVREAVRRRDDAEERYDQECLGPEPPPEDPDAWEGTAYEGCANAEEAEALHGAMDAEARRDAYGGWFEEEIGRILEADGIEYGAAVINHATYRGAYGDDYRVLAEGGERVSLEEAVDRAWQAVEDHPPRLGEVEGHWVVEQGMEG